MRIMPLLTMISVISLTKTGPNSSISGNSEEPTYLLKINRLDKQHGFSHTEMKEMYSLIQVLNGMLSLCASYRIVRDSGEEIILTALEVEQIYIELKKNFNE